MGLLICPACGSPASDAEPTCPSCHATLYTAVFDPGMVVAAGPVASDPAPRIEGAADIEHEHREASTTTPLQSDQALEESSSGKAETPAAPGGSTPANPARTGADPAPPTVPDEGTSSHHALRDHRPLAMLWRFRVLIAAAALLVGMAVLLQLRPGGRMQPVIAKQPQPTATATVAPSPTVTATPSSTSTPEPMPGYSWYVDNSARYMVQYPTTWTKTIDANLDVEFADGNLSNSGTYVLNVYHPDPNTSGVSAQGDSNSAAAAWVDFELSNLQQQAIANGQTFQRVPGPIPAAMIGGQSWQSGIATIDQVDNGQTLQVRLQVFATIHNGRPYIINVYARSDVFATGEQQYFTPILNTFQFLPISAQGS